MSCLGIISALPSEAKCFTKHPLPVNKPVCIKDGLFIIVSGMGFDCVKDACEQLLARQATTLVSWGTAAGLIDTLISGDLILPEIINTSSDQMYNTDSVWNQKINDFLTNSAINIYRNNIYSSDTLLNTPDQKMQTYMKTGCIAADMESGIIAKFASENNISFFVIRSVIDELNYSIPDCVTNNLDKYGHLDFYRLFLELFGNPNQVSDIYYLYHAMKKSCVTLTTIANKLQLMS